MAYLGTRGYTIAKANLDIAQQDRIRRELSVAPPATMFSRHEPYPVFRESTNRFYLPQFYGRKTFGPTTAPTKLKPPIKTNLKFGGKLRADQQMVADLSLHALRNKGGGLLELYCGYGKTVVGLYITAALGYKMAVLVHKEFLMTQWIERIEMFLPKARVGTIQGPVVDIEDKDIVLIMIQSFATKEYPMNIFAGFGLVIVDECHHMSAEVFSNALFKAVTPHMLGLSATMVRKDGLTRVFKMFLGDVIAKRERKDKIKPRVRVYFYQNPEDEDFNNTMLNYTGQVNYSAMMSKICKCEHRINYVLERIRELFDEDELEQVLTLTHYRAMINALSDRMTERKYEHGYYVGGMKQAELDASAKKPNVLGTFAMAEEGLDIRTIQGLVLATPKADVVQAVGRAQRDPEASPIIVDIVDPHPCFRRQYEKRLLFYNKNNFDVLEINPPKRRKNPNLMQVRKAQEAKKASRVLKLNTKLAQLQQEADRDEVARLEDEVQAAERELAEFLAANPDAAAAAAKASEARCLIIPDETDWE
jgi:superfamily II DNA or RNA helicase